jgi:two-component system chemotaxis response regulator CheY
MKKILIVEDDVATARAYRSSLERAGFEVHVASDGQQGLDFIQGTAPDGVLLDLMMPKVNGLQLLKCIRACHHLSRIPVMVYTNAFIPNLIEEARAAGATEVFAKSKLTPQFLILAFSAALPPG